jgi:hypothetical protein
VGGSVDVKERKTVNGDQAKRAKTSGRNEGGKRKKRNDSERAKDSMLLTACVRDAGAYRFGHSYAHRDEERLQPLFSCTPCFVSTRHCSHQASALPPAISLSRQYSAGVGRSVREGWAQEKAYHDRKLDAPPKTPLRCSKVRRRRHALHSIPRPPTDVEVADVARRRKLLDEGRQFERFESGR